ncbi:GTPase Ypt71 [Schizosaccharomyces osmophilus]|uniref:GTPase Ypt71 n=1 Tax=Schizosaccharomyces osmophilus TaxID=2545709 RepID=A0AAE9WBK6_9SCHI|nr:GTPase Ypt71 [Schizosaccharomyces osmophilus]WBW73342.1 GTPase Ypt71 [Schizosaccharomyces osmophilus]
MSSQKRLFVKVVILGDSGVGKTCLMNQFVNQKFSREYKATIGADFLTKDVIIDGKTVTLQLWDTAGQERFQSLGMAFYRGADCCVIVYNVNNAKSFESVENWKQEFLLQTSQDESTFPIIIVGNQIDKDPSKRAVPLNRALAYCKARRESPLPHFETSAKENSNVAALFEQVSRHALENETIQDDFVNDFSEPLILSKPPNNSNCNC